MARIVTCMGEAYSLSERAYQRMLRHVIAGEDCRLSQLGRWLGTVHNVTDLAPGYATLMLEESIELQQRRARDRKSRR